ncbi:DUF2786 domain-containing protein [Amycolatopsis sp. cmx-11-51]|uniref:DUF2786 domain-containing protein n=1 Tax=Amycolatopsis sp. cmx-11-51 TaxID=2785797 RepID=UPI0039E526F5
MGRGGAGDFPERVVADLAGADPVAEPRAVASGAGIAVAELLGRAWKVGWTPADVWEFIRRDESAPVVALLVDCIAVDLAKYAPSTVDDRWAGQVHDLGGEIWWERDRPHLLHWADRHGADLAEALWATVKVLASLLKLPELPQILPPPGSASARVSASANGVDHKVLAKVRGLLAKAESTEYPEEAEAFSAKAQELMNRYAFERALLDADANRKQTAASVRVWLDTPYVEAKSHLVAAIARANRSKSVFYSKLGFVALVGEAMDLEITELLTTSLLVQATRAMVAEGSQITRSGTSRTRSFRQSFLVSYAVRIGERLEEASSRAHDPVEDKRLLPVLAARSLVVEETFQKMFSHTVQRSATVSNGAGWEAGRAAADRADIDIERQAVDA